MADDPVQQYCDADAPDWLIGGGEMGKLIRSMDWSHTPLGPIASWPQSLRTTVGLCLASNFPISVVWGPKHTQIYNDGYWPICGGKHPRSMGQDFSECWASAWPAIGEAFAHALTGQTSYLENQRMFLDRNGFLEEAFFTFSFSPIRDETGGIGGLFHPVTETTSNMLSERRTRALRDLAARTGKAKTIEEAFSLSSQTLAEHCLDVPFALIYLLDARSKQARLAGSTGLPPGTIASPDLVDLELPGGPSWPLSEIARSGETVCVDDLPRRFGPLSCGPYPESPKLALALPITPPGSEQPAAILVAGVSSRLTLTEVYRGFYDLVAATVTAAVANALAYEEERRRAEALAEIDRAKTAFFSNVSHEFRTPLTLILGPLEDTLAEPSRTLQGHNLETVHRNALRLLKLVNALLDFSRIEAGRVQASFAPVDLAATTAELASVFRSAIERAGLALVVRCDPLPEPIYVDRDMWEKIVLNLLSNAFKFTFHGEIEVALRAVGDRVELTVRDTGIGVAPEELPRLFERFHRVEGVKARTHEGSGIGLALVQELVRMHGGEISVKSEVARGTTFTVALHRGSSHLPAARIGANPTLASTATGAAAFVEEALRWLPGAEDRGVGPKRPLEEGATLLAEATPARILVADDNADMREYLTRLLSRRWTVRGVSDGQAALEALEAERFDLVLADVMMPCVDGFALLHRVRSNAATRSLPVIMLSARAGEESRIEGLREGADDYLVKPFSARELIARVDTHLSLSRARIRAESQWRRLLSLFDQVPMPISIVAGPEHRYEFANHAFRELAGRDVAGSTIGEAFPDDTQTRDAIEIVQMTGEAVTLTEVPTGAGDRARCFNVVLQPWRDEEELRGVLCIGVDITEQVAARSQREQLLTREREARAEAVAANQAKDEFLAMLGHELRNPLSPVLTALQVMRLRGVRSREQDIIERQIVQFTRLIDDLLDVSRITQGKIELRKEPVEIARVLARAVEMASPLLEQHRQQLNVDVPPEGLIVYADPARLAQVVSNLLTNASKYSDRGSRVALSAERDGERVRLRVKDQGIGVAPEMLERIFDLFAQQSQALDRAAGGLGLGLAIVRSLVQLHGGTVYARSDGLGTGTELIVELPRADSAVVESRPSPAAPSTAPRVPSGKKRVLIVDDNDDAAIMLAEALRCLGHEVEMAPDGPSALVLAARYRPEIAILDIGLPVMDGYELAGRLRSLIEIPERMRLVAVTGYGQEADRRRSEAAGFNAHLVKPVDLDHLAESMLW